MASKTWTDADKQFLEDAWGDKSIPAIAKALGRSIEAIKLKACRLGLGRHLHSGTEITFPQLLQALGMNQSYGYYKQTWPKYGFPFKHKKSITRKFVVVNIDDFWKWAEKNKNLLNFADFETNALGKEPDWVPPKRRADIIADAEFKRSPWTEAEDRYLKSLLNSYKYGYKEIATMLHRTEGAIKRRMIDLNIKQRPIKADNHTPWQPDEIEKVKRLNSLGYEPDVIARSITRSACAVRGLLERIAKVEPTPVPEDLPKGTHYRKALPPEQWPKAELFIGMMVRARAEAIRTGTKANLDLGKLPEIFNMAERMMA